MNIKKYRCIFEMGVQNAMEYRFDFFMKLISMIFPVVTSICLWTAVNNNAGSVVEVGYTYPQLLLYTILAALISNFASSGFENEINKDIKMGGLNKYLVKPISYIKYRYFAFMGKRFPSIVLLLVVTTMTMAFFVYKFKISVDVINCAFFLFSLFLAVTLRFLLFFCVAMWSFWYADASGMFGTVRVVIWVISGGIFPISILGNNVERISKILPFQYLTGFNVDIICGRLSQKEIIVGLVVIITWIFILEIMAKFLWNRGLKKYVAVGG